MIRPLFLFPVLLALAAGFALAQEPVASAASGQEEIRAMRLMIEQQSLKIEALAQQINKLSRLVEAREGGHAVPAVTPQSLPQEPPAKAAEVRQEPETKKAEAVPAGVTHVVARGETLTSISKHYKTNVADLLKANKIEDDRKLQIGQVLTIPTPKETETQAPKKEIE